MDKSINCFMKQHFYFVITLFLFSLVSCSDSDSLKTNWEITTEKVELIASKYDIELEIDDSITKDNSLNFDTWEDFEDFIIEVESLGLDNNSLIAYKFIDDSNETLYETKGCGDGLYGGSHSMLGGMIKFNITAIVEDGCITSVSGGVSGVTLGWTYTQGESSTSCNGGTICGYTNFNVFVEGVGTVYRQYGCVDFEISGC